MSQMVPAAQLVARCRNGDQEAWASLVERFSRYVYAIATQGFRLRDHDAEDVFQEVFTKVYERLDTLRSDDAFQPWIAQLTRRVCVDRLRAGSREEMTDESDLAADPDEDAIGRIDDALDVHDAMNGLPENRTIGDALELPPGTIASRISRCLIKLREELEGRKPVPAQSGEQVNV
jgi:DNA-directed RNA polymerase specialized sigma24 family protein